MKATIDVKDRKEAAQIRAGLDRPDVRAFVKVMGVLHGLPSDQARARVLQFMWDTVDEEGAVSEVP